MTRITAGELNRKVSRDTTKYNAMEVGHAMADDISIHVRQAIQNHINIINEPEFCVVMIIAKDPILSHLLRRKFYCWPYLPNPRPNQAVWLYRKRNDSIKRLWILPSDMVMAELHSLPIVDKKYKTMKAWSDAFYKGWKVIKDNPNDPKCTKKSFINTDPSHFWAFIRKNSDTDMLSEHEYLNAHREELIKAGCQESFSPIAEPFDFSKVQIKNVIDTVAPVGN